MLEMLIISLVVIWLLVAVGGYALNGIMHMVMLGAIALIISRAVQGKRV
jgi:hypothetical protein